MSDLLQLRRMLCTFPLVPFVLPVSSPIVAEAWPLAACDLFSRLASTAERGSQSLATARKRITNVYLSKEASYRCPITGCERLQIIRAV